MKNPLYVFFPDVEVAKASQALFCYSLCLLPWIFLLRLSGTCLPRKLKRQNNSKWKKILLKEKLKSTKRSSASQTIKACEQPNHKGAAQPRHYATDKRTK